MKKLLMICSLFLLLIQSCNSNGETKLITAGVCTTSSQCAPLEVCEISSTLCIPNPCSNWETYNEPTAFCELNGGRCIDNTDCLVGEVCNFQNICITPANPCLNIICSGEGVCVDAGGFPTCNCNIGFQDNDNNTSCLPNCSTITCPTGTNCDDSGGESICLCANGGVYHSWGCSSTPIKISLGLYHTCTLFDNETVACWGDIFSESYPIITAKPEIPRFIDIVEGVADIVSGGYHSCVLTINNRVFCWGSNFLKQINNQSDSYFTTPQEIIFDETPISIGAGVAHTCVLTTLGNVYCWGNNGYGQLGNKTYTSNGTPQKVIFDKPDTPLISQLFVGGNHNHVILTDGTSWSWGYNGYGQLGLNRNWKNYGSCRNAGCASASENNPVKMSELITDDTKLITKFYLGGSYSCGEINGSVYCWGDNSYGQFGIGGTETEYLIPDTTALQLFDQYSAGKTHFCGILGGAPYCWGRNGEGILGINSTIDKNTPQLIESATNWSFIVAGFNHTCGIESGTIFCWGDNTKGESCNSEKVDQLIPNQCF